MRKVVINGRVQSFKYDDISFLDKKTNDQKVIKKITCNILDMESDDTIIPVEFWGQKGMDMFMDIMEGDPVVCAFVINTRPNKTKGYFISFKGIKIEKYLGMTVEDKMTEGKNRNEYYRGKKDSEPIETFADREFKESQFANESMPENIKPVDDLPF